MTAAEEAWRLLEPDDMENPGLRLRINGRDLGKTVSDYSDLYLAGGTPYLLGMRILFKIEVMT